MMPHSLNGVYPDGSCQVFWEDGERVFCRGRRLDDDGSRSAVLFVLPAAEHPSSSSLDRLTHEPKHELDGGWALRPAEFVREGGRAMLVLVGCWRRAARPAARRTHRGGMLPAPGHRYCHSSRQAPPTRPRLRGHQTGEYPGELRGRPGAARGVRPCPPPCAQAASARSARVYCRHARLRLSQCCR
jgi:hypothetical protein